MVTRRVVSLWKDAPVPTEEQLASHDPADRKIEFRQVYDPKQVRAILDAKGTSGILLWSAKCRKDVAEMVWGDDDVIGLLREALDAGVVHRSEWCTCSEGGPIAVCDVYTVDRREKHPTSGNPMLMKYYIKFAIGMNGNLMLIASCHPSRKS